jgi:hypothetical protein
MGAMAVGEIERLASGEPLHHEISRAQFATQA